MENIIWGTVRECFRTLPWNNRLWTVVVDWDDPGIDNNEWRSLRLLDVGDRVEAHPEDQFVKKTDRGGHMGAQATLTIRRTRAIERVREISDFIRTKDWRAMETSTRHEDAMDPHELYEELRDSFWAEQPDAEKLSNGQLATLMDMPYFRFSTCDNYIVVEDDYEGDSWRECRR